VAAAIAACSATLTAAMPTAALGLPRLAPPTTSA